jgi:hypothetical protein
MKPMFFWKLAAVCALAGAQTIAAQTARTQPGNNAPVAAAPSNLGPARSQPAARGLIPIGSKLTFGGTNAPRTYHARTTFSSTPVVVAKGKVKIWQDQVATDTDGMKGEWDIFHMETTDGGRLAGNIKDDWNILMDYDLREAVYFDAVVTQFAVSGTPVDPLYNFGSICCATSSNPILPGEAYYNSGFQVALAKGRQKDWEEIYIDPYDFASAGGIDPKTANQLTFALHFTRQKKAAVITSDAREVGAGVGVDQGTFAKSVDSAGAIAGYYIDASGVSHGFLRAPDGFVTSFDVPGAGTAPGHGTFAYTIDTAGAITGDYTDAGNISHGFVRAASGVITRFQAPGVGMGIDRELR